MRRAALVRFYQRALAWVQAHSPIDAWGHPDPFRLERMSARKFIEGYCWVIYVSGFRVAVVRSHWPAMRAAYKRFDLDRLARTKVSKRLLSGLPIKSERKAEGFLAGCRIVADWGWPQYRAGLLWERRRHGDEAVMSVLEELPFIGSITKRHLAMRIGFDVAKPDVHLTWAAREFNAEVDEMVEHLSRRFGHSRRYVDGIIFEYRRVGPGT